MEMKNICGKIPLDLHEKVREEIERTESSTQKFILKVIEEHFNGKGEMNMEKRTLAVQVSEELFSRLKAVVAKKGCKQKDFLIAIIEQAIETAETEWEQAQENAESGTESETGEMEEESTPSEEMTDSESEVA
jgi:predicted DNA binding CopG/RHH family protein